MCGRDRPGRACRAQASLQLTARDVMQDTGLSWWAGLRPLVDALLSTPSGDALWLGPSGSSSPSGRRPLVDVLWRRPLIDYLWRRPLARAQRVVIALWSTPSGCAL
ncbi:hypothetical protein F2P81_016403 [Scophthalmus maximus]|uniref:Uncharacterized protein n=1 Tax=Scophthalmus maximus TaxID=52904 RepID=A0A6A4SI02_SCOMX|nr:hypothetical protein F2P81_016403 [Scophthalmus maximus]